MKREKKNDSIIKIHSNDVRLPHEIRQIGKLANWPYTGESDFYRVFFFPSVELLYYFLLREKSSKLFLPKKRKEMLSQAN